MYNVFYIAKNNCEYGAIIN